jgi:FkbM family methyltransferase
MLRTFVIFIVGLLLMAIVSFESFKVGYKTRRNESLLVNPIHRRFKFSTNLPNGLTFLGHAGSNIDDTILRDGYYEPEVVRTLQLIAKHLKTLPSKSSSGQENEIVFLDVGANIGAYTLAMATEVDRLIAVEPYQPVLDRLYAHIKENDLNNVEVLEVGFGDRKERQQFLPPPNYYIGMGTFSIEKSRNHRGAQNPSKKKNRSLLLPVERGDDLLKGVAVDIIKLDVEGYERFVLEGLNNTLARSRPTIMLELKHNGNGVFVSEEQLRDVLPEHYALFFFNYYPRKACLAPIADRWNQAQRLLAVPSELAPFVRSLVTASCLSTISEITFPFVHELRGIREFDIPEK